jgi:Bifunctional DNA primase/polymerase, N-terminal
MIELEWEKHQGVANIGISCGPSNLVVLDEDQQGELERWCVTYGFSLPDTYTVTTGRGRHLYFRWDHSVKRISNSPKAVDGFKIDVRGDGGFAVAEGSQHKSGATYLGNSLDIAKLPAEVAELLLAENHSPPTQPERDWRIAEADFNVRIPFHERHDKLVEYAGRLRKSGLDYSEVLPSFEKRWHCCEQPEGQIPEALYHDAACEYPCTWDEAKDKLRDVFTRYPAGNRPDTDEFSANDEPTTWEPVDLEPSLSGEKTQPEPTLGMYRSDRVQLIYPGREHVVLGDTEAGKSWFALGCVRAELNRGHRVVYIHYEEPDETSTIERLLLLGVDKDVIRKQFKFYGPMRPVRKEWLQPLIDFKPSLVVHDGVNEAMTLHSNIIKDVEGASEFRRRLVMPFTRAGIATLGCDHLPLVKDGSRIAAFGTVHKGNALDGTRIMLENFKPFGRAKRGVSNVFVTKDRPGFLRAHGNATKTPGKTFMGCLVVDDMAEQPDFLMKFYAPHNLDDDDDITEETGPESSDTDAELAFPVWRLIYESPGHAVESVRKLFAVMRNAGLAMRDDETRNILDDLTVAGRLEEVPGRRGATGYRVKPPMATAQPLRPDVDYLKEFENDWDA